MAQVRCIRPQAGLTTPTLPATALETIPGTLRATSCSPAVPPDVPYASVPSGHPRTTTDTAHVLRAVGSARPERPRVLPKLAVALARLPAAAPPPAACPRVPWPLRTGLRLARPVVPRGPGHEAARGRAGAAQQPSRPDNHGHERAPNPQVGAAARWSLDRPKLAYNDEVRILAAPTRTMRQRSPKHLPQPRRPVAAAGGEQPPVRAERHHRHQGVVGEAGAFLPPRPAPTAASSGHRRRWRAAHRPG
jgi:hypothetical protein